MSNTQLINPNPFALLHYEFAGVDTYYLMLNKQVKLLRQRYQSVNINNDGDIPIIRMNGEPPRPDDANLIIVTSDTQQPPDDDPNAGRIRIVPVSAESRMDNTVSLIQIAFGPFQVLTPQTLNGYVDKVISFIRNPTKGGRIRRSSSTRRAAKKRASTRRRGRSAKKRATRSRAH
jgi:hypothetical protein